MRTRTIMMLGAAALCAGAAATLTSIITRVEPPPKPTATERQPERSRQIVVASRNFAPGDRIDPAMLQRIDWPTSRLPSGAFSNVNAVAREGRSRFALAPIAKGEPVLSSKLSLPGKRPALLSELDESKSAVTISVNTVQGVAGFIQPNDRVDVLLTRKTKRGDVAAAGGSSIYTDILLQNIRVLAIDQSQNRTPKAKPARAVTLEVDQIEAQKLILGGNVGTLSLALKNTTAKAPGHTRRISLDDLPGPTKPTNGGVQGSPSVITIYRGTTSKRYGVQDESLGQRNHNNGAGGYQHALDPNARPAKQSAPTPAAGGQQHIQAQHRTTSPSRIPRPINARTPSTVQSWSAQTTVTRADQVTGPAVNPLSARDPKK